MIRKISVRDLKPGMFVAGLPDNPLLDAQRVYPVEGYVRSAEEIVDIIRRGFREVFVDLRSAVSEHFPGVSGRGVALSPEALGRELERELEREMDRELARLPELRPDTFPGRRADPEGERLREEVARARRIYAENVLLARRLFAEAAQGRALSLDAAREGVSRTLEGLREDPAAALWAARLEEGGARLHLHSANVSLLGMAFGVHLGLGSEEVRDIGLAGLLHDLGQTRLPLELTVRSGALSPREHALFARHPREGEALLRRQGGLSGPVLRAVAEHHERHDGGGYPARLSGASRGLFGRILALADQFDHLSRPGGDARSESPARATTLLYAGRGTAHSAEDLERFVRFIGVYPPGSPVRLTDGRAGLVWRHDPANPLAPLVNVILDPRLRPLPTERLDLAAGSARGLKVAAPLREEDLGVSARRLVPA